MSTKRAQLALVFSLALMVTPVGYVHAAEWPLILTAAEAPGLPGVLKAAVLARGFRPRASGEPKACPLTPKPGPSPRINGASVFGVRPGSPFLFKIPATGERPITFAAVGLPPGLRVDSSTGQITGVLRDRGEYPVTFKATNARGTAEKKFKIVCGDRLALTPHMGWNSWYVWENNVTDRIMREAAEAMVASGMIDHGYMYVNIDDCWSVKPGAKDPTLQGEPRDKQGRVNSNPRFPDMKALTDHIHSLGLKAGIYTSPGPTTCAGHVAAYQHERQDVERFVEWGFDFLKYDWCSYGQIAKDKSLEEYQKPYRLISGILRQQPRDIVLNLCQYGMGGVWTWGKEVGGNSWRTAGDLGGSFEKIGEALFRDGFDLYAKAGLHRYGGPGGWNDPDYLLLGYLSNWKGQTVPTPLTPDEQYAHVSLWCLLAAPLIFSGDITRLDEFTLGLLTNDEVIEVDQDALGAPGRRVAKDGDLEVWAKEMEDGSLAVGLFNRGEGFKTVTAAWRDLGVAGPWRVRDLWRQKDVGVFENSFEAFVGRHGVVFVRLWPLPSAARAGRNYALFAPDDDLAAKVAKAARVVPSPRQLAWQEREVLAFAHFGMNTFTDREWGQGTEDPALFNPTDFDARQWAKAVKDVGMKTLIVTAKHHDGFCLWPSRLTAHSVAGSPWRGGRGDVVGEVAKACREVGLGFGIYLSPWDRHEPTYGDSPKYNEFFRGQLRELLTDYGRVDEVWFDGANGEGPNGKRQVYDWTSYYKVIRELQPEAVIAIMGPDVRWVGTESGYGRETEWSVVPADIRDPGAVASAPQDHPLDGAFLARDLMGEDLGSRDKLAAATAVIWHPAETDVSIRPGWFYHAKDDARVKTPEKLVDIYFSSVGRNGVLLLNIPPDRRGRIHDNDIASLAGMRRILDETFKTNLAAGAKIRVTNTPKGHEPASILAAHPTGYWVTNGDAASARLELEFPEPRTFDTALLAEHIRAGQRIEKFSLERWDGTDWLLFAQGTTVGAKRLLRFPAVTAQRVRLAIDQVRLNPALSAFGLYKSPAR
jgi:alpha-L-fucosidase